MEENTIRFYLLRKQPQIFVNGDQPRFSPQALKLLIYLAESGETEYDREELVRFIYGTELARDTFRKKVLYPIRKLVPTASLEMVQSGIMYFARDRVWVDSRVFAENAGSLLQTHPIFKKKDYEAAKVILELYEDPFLAEYHPRATASVDDTQFLSWQRSRQRDLTALYHRLLDGVISFCLSQQRYWADAQYFAELWTRSLHPSARPLQYLIWLATRQHSDALNTYLEGLRAREEAGELPIGLSWSEWNRLLKSGQSIPLSRLLPQADGLVEDRAYPLAGDPIDRKEVLDQILMLFATPGQQTFALTGLPGAGKTETAQAAAQLLLERNPGSTVVMLELTSQLDWELLCNELLNSLGRKDLLTLDYAKKRQRLKQLLQAPNLAIIVDEGHTTHLADLNTLNTVLAILSGARVLLVARQLARFEHYVIELPGLNKTQTRHFLLSRVPWLKEIGETQFTEIADLTRGLPLLLHIIAGGLKKELGRVHSLIDYLKTHDLVNEAAGDIYAVYKSVLAWLWQYLDSKDKDLLHAISLFAPTEGANSAALSAVLTNVIPDDRFQQKVSRLIDLHLIQPKSAISSEPYYLLHPIIFDFIQQQAQHLRRPYTHMIEQTYISYLLNFISSHHNQMERLDEHKQNILRMFDLVVLNDDHTWARRQALEALNQVFPYFETRGLYDAASRLIARALELDEFEAASAHIQMLRNAAKIAYLRADEKQALNTYEKALDLAKTASVPQQYASLHFDIGNVQLQSGRFEDAIRSFEAAEQTIDSERQRRLLYSIWSNLGVSAFRQGHFDLARYHYEKVLGHLNEGEGTLPPEFLAIAQHNQTALGLTFTELGDYETALQHFQQSMELARQINYPQLLGYLYLNMGFAYSYRREYDEAANCFGQAESIAEQIQHAALRVLVTFNQGMLASRRFLHAEAFRLHRIALIQTDDHELEWLKPQIWISLGKTYLRNEQFDPAGQYFSQVFKARAAANTFVSQAIYGMALSAMLKTQLIGSNNVQKTLEVISPLLTAISEDYGIPNETVNYLDWAHMTFQRDLDHLPQLERYRIVEALQSWLSSQ